MVKDVIWESTVGRSERRDAREFASDVVEAGMAERWWEDAMRALWEREESFWRLRLREWRDAERDDGSVSMIELRGREERRAR